MWGEVWYVDRAGRPATAAAEQLLKCWPAPPFGAPHWRSIEEEEHDAIRLTACQCCQLLLSSSRNWLRIYNTYPLRNQSENDLLFCFFDSWQHWNCTFLQQRQQHWVLRRTLYNSAKVLSRQKMYIVESSITAPPCLSFGVSQCHDSTPRTTLDLRL